MKKLVHTEPCTCKSPVTLAVISMITDLIADTYAVADGAQIGGYLIPKIVTIPEQVLLL